MKKISVITLLSTYNYGSALQAFATQKVFEGFGMEVSFINYRRIHERGMLSRIQAWVKHDEHLEKVIKGILLLPSLIKQQLIFSRFLRKYVNIEKGVYTTNEDFARLSITSDIYCTGSDQTWNSDWNEGILPPLFLHFVPENIIKIAYSASFGKSTLNESEKEITRNFLRRYKAISVRENSGVQILNDLGVSNSVHLIDPTLQLDKEFWKRYTRDRKYKEPYVLIYQLNTNRLFDHYAEEFAKRKGARLIRFCTRFDQIVKCGKATIAPEVFDFVSLIYHANCVITDSFHATAFSINFNTDFISIYPKEFGERINSILKLTGLEHRHLTSYDDLSAIDNEGIDFTHANEILNRERYKSKMFLQQALETTI